MDNFMKISYYYTIYYLLLTISCVGVGVQSGIQRSSSESSNLCNIGMLPSLTWPKSFSSAHREKRYGLKSTVGNDCTFTKGGSSRNFATETCQISEM